MPNAELAVEPGGHVSTTVTVYNPSAVVEEYTIEVLGPCAGFMQAVPDRVSLLPGDEATVEIMFTPPAGRGTEAGRQPFGVRAISGVDDYFAAVVEGALDLGAVYDLDARLVTVAGTHRWVGRYRAEFTNSGTAPVALDLAMMAEAEDLGFALAPTQLDLERGESGEAFIKVRPRGPFLIGQPRRHSFQLAYQRDVDPNASVDPTAEGTLDGTFEQRPVASRRLLIVAGLAVAAVIALIAFLPQAAPPAEAAVPPQTPPTPTVAPTDAADALLISWTRDPTATEYRIDQLLNQDGEQRVVDSVSVGGERDAHRFEGLEPATQHCFQLVAVNDAGPSDPTEPACGQTPAAPATEQPDESQTAGGEAGQPTGAPGDDQQGQQGQPTGAPGDPNAPGGSFEPEGAYVIYSATAIDDPASGPAAEQLAVNLQSAGVQDIDLVDSRRSEALFDGTNDAGLLVVLRDGFASQAEAAEHCNDPQIREIAPQCFAFAPFAQ